MHQRNRPSRRQFLTTTAYAIAAGTFAGRQVFAAESSGASLSRSPNQRLGIGAIGMRYQGTVAADKAVAHGDIVAICDVDREIGEKAVAHFGGKATLVEDYRKLLERKDVDVVIVGTPDHWHTPMVVNACRAGKDIYCEKPLTLTIDEGKLLCRVVKETGRIVQVGSWQRSDSKFRLAAEMIRAGRIGKVRKVTVNLAKNVAGGPFKEEAPPPNLNWDLWLGPAPAVPYIKERCHFTFRWWYEYSGGQMTDNGVHYLDIVQWALNMDDSGPVEIEGKCTLPNIPSGYNVATSYQARYVYADGTEVTVLDGGKTGITFEGADGTIVVTRGSLTGKPVDALKDNPLPPERFKLYPHDNLTRPQRTGKLEAMINHFGNFADCVVSRKPPISEIVSQHRAVTVCHLGNISMRLGRKLKWDPQTERFVGDEQANTWLSRPSRGPYGVTS